MNSGEREAARFGIAIDIRGFGSSDTETGSQRSFREAL
jgi:hypothetical protein